MARQTKSFWVGLFVLAGFLIALTALVWLGSTSWFAKKKTFVTYFTTSVQGLNMDSSVKFRGVDVGKVKGLRIAPDGNLIEVTLALEPSFKVDKTMRTRLGFTGITGLKYIEVDYVDPDVLPRHPELKFKPPHPVIPSAPGGFEEIGASLREIYAKLLAVDTEGISWKAKSFFDTGTRMMASIDSLARAPELTQWMNKLGRTADRVDSMLAALETRRYNREIDSTLVQLRQGSHNFNRLMAGLREDASKLRMSERSDTLFANVDGLVTSSQEMIRRSQYVTLQTLNRLNATMDQMNAAITQLNSLMLSLETNPSNMLYALPPPGEK